jgi:hypothetical protein
MAPLKIGKRSGQLHIVMSKELAEVFVRLTCPTPHQAK